MRIKSILFLASLFIINSQVFASQSSAQKKEKSAQTKSAEQKKTSRLDKLKQNIHAQITQSFAPRAPLSDEQKCKMKVQALLQQINMKLPLMVFFSDTESEAKSERQKQYVKDVQKIAKELNALCDNDMVYQAIKNGDFKKEAEELQKTQLELHAKLGERSQLLDKENVLEVKGWTPKDATAEMLKCGYKNIDQYNELIAINLIVFAFFKNLAKYGVISYGKRFIEDDEEDEIARSKFIRVDDSAFHAKYQLDPNIPLYKELK
jgi:hypothetical protein